MALFEELLAQIQSQNTGVSGGGTSEAPVLLKPIQAAPIQSTRVGNVNKKINQLAGIGTTASSKKTVNATSSKKYGSSNEEKVESFAERYKKLRAEQQAKKQEREEEKAEREAEKDIAPTKLDFFQKNSLFNDGYDFGDISKTILGTAGDVGVGLLKGAGSLVEGLTDLGTYGAAYVADAMGNDAFAAKARRDAQRNKIEEISGGADAYLDKYSVLGRTSDALTQGLGQVAGIIATGGLGAAAGLGTVGTTALTTGVMGMSGMGSGMSEAYEGGADDKEAAIYGAISGASDALTELMFGGLGKAVKAVGLSKGLSSADDMLAKKISGMFTNQIAKNISEFGVKASAEGVEEIAAGVAQAIGKKMTYMSEKELADILEDENLLEQFVVGAATSGMIQSGIVPGMSEGSLKEANAEGKDFITGLDENEQAVIKKELENRIAEREADGEKLSKRDKAKLEEQVLKDMEKGYISTDTIEEVLGGESYTTYKQYADYEDAVTKEFDELGKKQNATLAEQKRYNELSQQMDDIKANSQRSKLKSQLGEEVFGLVQGGKLAESYNERGRRSEAYTADMSRYSEAQQKVIQKAVDSGILNNTNRTHEFVDMVAKISADKGVLFDFTNNAKLKESGFAVDGKQVNGFVTKDGITLNTDSAKYLNTVVGHEITHVLEGTEVYTELQKVLFEYSKNKGDFSNRRANLAELYKDVKDADIDAELTADLVGDYLFTDSDFINNLSTNNRNVFQKIYDEIKYLCKVVTAGSKEARELEKVKRAFEQAYKNSGKANADVKYSLTTDSSGKELSKEQQDYFKDSKVRDENGSLKVMYHGSRKAGFHTFDSGFSDDGISLFFVDRNDVAATYSGFNEEYSPRTLKTADDFYDIFAEIEAEDMYEVKEENGKFVLYDSGEVVAESDTAKGIYEEWTDYSGLGSGAANYKVYLNLKNPLEVDANGRNWNRVNREFSQEVYDIYQSLTEKEKEALYSAASWEDFNIFVDKLETAATLPDMGRDGGSLESAYQKLFLGDGAKADRYDLFSIASDNFSEEAIKEYSVKWLNTRDYAQRAKEQGYDGVIFKNIVDLGGYSNGSEGAATVAVAFDSNQIKSVANAKPTEDADIRYSLSEYSAEEKKAHNEAVLNHFGKTYKWAETGYVLLDGSRLDLSGKHEGAPGGYRTVDHRDIVDALGDDYGNGEYSGSLVQFMSEGNIRISPECNGINLSVKPTKAQEQSLSNFISSVRGEVLLDIDGLDGYTVVSVEYPRGTHANKVLNDIRGWFDNGTKPEDVNTFSYSLTKQGEAPVRHGDYNVSGKDIALEQEIAPVKEVVSKKENTTVPEQDAYFAPTSEKEAMAGAEERFASLSDEDIPPEIEAPYPGESSEEIVSDPFEDRDYKEVGNRKVKAFMWENPEVKPKFQFAAEVMLNDLRNSIKGERFYNDQLAYDTNHEYGWTGQSRQTTDDIAYLLDSGYTYAQIEKGLKAIIEDNGAENNAISKRIEFALNDRLYNGFTDINGYEIPADQEYIDALGDIQMRQTAEESFGTITDADAPPVIEENTATDDIAPVKPVEQTAPKLDEVKVKGKGNIRGQKVISEVAATKEAPKDTKTANIVANANRLPREKRSTGLMAATKLVDKGQVFENLSLETGNMELQAKYDYALPSKSEARAQFFMERGSKKDGVKSLDSIRKAVGKNEADFDMYLYHQHNIDRMTLDERFGVPNKAVYGDSVTAEDSRKMVAALEKAHPEFKQIANDVYKYNNHLRKLLVDNGVISQKTAALWQKMYPHYVPIHRVDDAGVSINVPLDSKKTGVNAPVKRATGGSSDFQTAFKTMAERTIQTYKAIAKNSFGVELKNTLGSTITQNTAALDEVIDSIDTHEELLKPGKQGMNPTFTVFENGERVEFEITEDMFDALKPADPFLSQTIKPLKAVSEIRRNMLTSWNPVFALYRNPVKDLQDVVINSQHPAKTYMNVPKAVIELASNGKYATEYFANGGKQNTYYDSDKNTFDQKNNVFKTITGIGALERAGEFIEAVPRLAEYIASREDGRTVERSMLDAARVTTNFAAGGDVTKFVNRHGVTFLNASVQGAAQHVRNIREAKMNGLKGWVKLAAKYTAAGLPAMLLNSLLWEDDEEYEELSEYVKDSYYVIAKTEDGKFIRIPKGRTAAVIQDGLEQIGRTLTGDEEADWNNFFKLFMDNIAPNNPLDNNIFAPIGQALKNKTWYGEDLVPSRLADLPAEEQFDESTDAISKWLGEKTGWSPVKINYLLDQYSGGLGDMVLPMLTPEAESGAETLKDYAIAPWKKEITTDKVLNNKYPGEFYEMRDVLEINSNARDATEEDNLKFMYMDEVGWEMSALYAEKREIQNSDMSNSEKYEAIKDVQAEINALAEKALRGYNNVYHEGLYAEVGDKRFDYNSESGKWYEITPQNYDGSDNWYYQKEQEVTKGLGISYSDYWNNREEYNFAYDKPGRYAIAQAVGGYRSYMEHYDYLENWQSDNYLAADKDEKGESISGTRKTKVIDYINNLDLDYGEKLILYRTQYSSKADKKAYNMEIIDYLNSRDDIDYQEMKTILEELDMKVDSEGNITW